MRKLLNLLCILLALQIILTGCKTNNNTSDSSQIVSNSPVTQIPQEETTQPIQEIEKQAQPIWSSLPEVPIALLGPCVTAVNNKIYVLGGAYIDGSKGVSSNRVFEFDPSNMTWTEKSPMLIARDSFGVAVVGNKIYTVGGYLFHDDQSIEEISSVEEYDTETDQWISKSPLNYPRAKLSVAEANGKIYAIGGMESNWNKVEEYDPETDQWTEKKDAVNPKRKAGIAVIDNKIYCISGEVPDGSTTVKFVEEYDPSIDTWTTKAEIPVPRTDMAVAVVDGKIYVMGGWTETGILSSILIYNPSDNSWETGNTMTSPRYYFGATSIDSKIYVACGTRQLPSSSALFEILEWK